MPVLMGFGGEDDVAGVVRREMLEAAVVAPVLPHLHEVSRMRALYSFAGGAPSAARGGVSPLLPRNKPTSRYQNILSARPTAAATPITAETSMLPVPGSR